MKIRVKNLGEAKKYDFSEDTWVKVKQFPVSKGVIEGTADGFVRITNKNLQDAFVECLVDWGGWIDEDTGKEIKLTKELKQALFDFQDPALINKDGTSLVQFVLQKAKVNAEDKEKEEGN